MNLREICVEKLKEKGLNDLNYLKRLDWELLEIEVQNKENYFIDLYNRCVKYPENQNNLLVPYLLDIVKDFDINQDPAFFYGDLPDVDTDYLPAVREYLKNEWAPKTFGEQYVCNIGNYTTYGIKSSLIDMARVHDKDRGELLALTTKLQTKDDEGKALTWESAMKLDPGLKKYCDDNPDIAKAAHRLIDRNRGMGVHAGGLIISSIPLTDLVPLVKRRDDPQASAWVEGLHGQDLQPVGLVKFDLLVISNLLQIAHCCRLVHERHGIEKICALPGKSNWTDVDSYRNDEKALAMANEGDLKCIFQFDSDGIRNLAKSGGVTRFEDLVAYSALYRPGPLNMKMHERYIERKRGREEYELHPILDSILEKTYGVIAYQEQVMKILNVVGDIPMRDVETVRKAISKKKVEQFIKYKEVFIKNGSKNLNQTEEELESFWGIIESWAEYGFNASMTKETLISHKNGTKKIQDFIPGDRVYCIDQQGNKVETEVIKLHDHGQIEGFEVTFDDGYQITCSANHKFLTEKGQVSLKEICRTDSYILCDQQYKENYAKEKRGGMEESLRSSSVKQTKLHQTSVELQCLQENSRKKEARCFKICSSVRKEDDDQKQTFFPSKALHKMPPAGLEKIVGNACSEMWSRVSNMEKKRTSFENLRKMQRNQARKYQEKDGQAQQGQSFPGAKEDILRYSKKNFSATGTALAENRESSDMAGKEPRKVFGKHSKSLVFTKTISNGELVEDSIGLEIRKDSLWRRKEECGLCEKQNMDRSRWFLSLLRTPQQFGESISFAQSSSTRSNAQRGMHQEKECDAFKVGHGMFSFFDRRNENGDLGLDAGHSPISDTGNLVCRKIVRIVPVGKCHMFDLEVANPTHNFILPNGIVTSNSHATAYTYVSSRLLYLKSHYPSEFYTAILMCEDNTDKIKEYRKEIIKHDVKINKININKSKANFSLVDDEIYFGFSNVKGIGINVANQIVEKQPYANFEDFIDRFGTDSSVLKPLIATGCFKGFNPVTLFKFSEAYKDYSKKKIDRKKRHQASNKKNKEVLMDLIDSAESSSETKERLTNGEIFPMDSKDLKKVSNCEIWKERYRGLKINGKDLWKEVCKLINKMTKSKEKFKLKDDEDKPSLESFDPTLLKIDKKLEKELMDSIQECEKKYYGFSWLSKIRTSPDYKGGCTFDSFTEGVNEVLPVETEIISINKRKGKRSEYYQLKAEDENGDEGVINIWIDDYNSFQNEMVVGNFIRLRLNSPSNGFKTYTLSSIGPRSFYKKKQTTKDDDYRLVLLRKPDHTFDEITTEQEKEIEKWQTN